MAINFDFGALKDKAVELAQAGAAKTKKASTTAKLKADNLAQQDAVRKAYLAIGKKYYEDHAGAPDEAYIELFAKAEAALAAIAANNAKIAELKTVEEIPVDVDIEVEMQAGEMPAEVEDAEAATEADFAEAVPAEAAPVEAAPETPTEEIPTEQFPAD